MNRLISIFTALCFIFSVVGSDIAHAIPVKDRDYGNIENPISFIPFNLGKVIESKTFDNSRYTVINIQDLHCHIEAQKNIEQIIENLQKNYNISAIFVEGGYGEVDTSIFGRVKDENLRNNIIEGLFEKGRLTGAEYYYLKNEVKTPFYGLEDKQVHQANLERLSKVLNDGEKYNEKLSEIKSEIEYLKAKYFSRENNRFTATYENYKSGKMPAERYYALLRKYIEKLNQNDEKYNSFLSISAEKYPVFTAYCELLKAGKKIDFNKATFEMQSLVNHLKDNLSYNEYNKLSLATAGFSNIEELSLRLPDLSKKYGININQNSSLGSLISYIEASRSINPVEMLDEERRIAEDIRAAFSAGDEELEISFLSDFFIYLESFLNAKITASDYEFFEKEYARFEKIYSKYAFKNTLSELRDDIDFLTEYYSVNKNRNAIFVKNIEKRINKNSGDELVIVVTGGFHSEGLNKIFAENRTSYISVMPSVTQETESAEENYNSFLALGSAFSYQTLALALASQSAKSEIAQMMIDAAASELAGLAYNKENVSFILNGISEALAEPLGFDFSSSETAVVLSDGFKINLKNSNGTIEVITRLDASNNAVNAGFNFSAAVPAAAAEAVDGAALYDAVFNPDTFKTVKNIMRFAAAKNIVTGDGLIFDIETDMSLPSVIMDVEQNLMRKMPEGIQKAILKAYKRDEAFNSESRIAARIFLAAYSALGYDKAVLDILMPQEEASRPFVNDAKQAEEDNEIANDSNIFTDSAGRTIAVVKLTEESSLESRKEKAKKFNGYKSLIASNRAAMSAIGASDMDGALKYLGDMIEELALIDADAAVRAKIAYQNIKNDWNENKDVNKHIYINSNWNEENLEQISEVHTLINAVHQLGLHKVMSLSKDSSRKPDYKYTVSYSEKYRMDEREITVSNYSETEITPKVKEFISNILHTGGIYYSFKDFYVSGNIIICSAQLGRFHSVEVLVDLDSHEDGIISAFYDPDLARSIRDNSIATSRIGRIFGLAAVLKNNEFSIADYKISSGIQVRYSAKDMQNMLSEYAEKFYVLIGFWTETTMEQRNGVFRRELGYSEAENIEAAKITTLDFRNDSEKLKVKVLQDYVKRINDSDCKHIFTAVKNARSFFQPIYDILGIPESRQLPEEIERYIAEGRAEVNYAAQTAKLNEKYNPYEKFTEAFAEFESAKKDKARDFVRAGYVIDNLPYEDLFLRPEAVIGNTEVKSGWLKLSSGKKLSVKVITKRGESTIEAAYTEIVDANGKRSEIKYSELKSLLEAEGYKITERKLTDGDADKKSEKIIREMKRETVLVSEDTQILQGKAFAKGTGEWIKGRATYNIDNNSKGKILIKQEFAPGDVEKAAFGEGVVVMRGSEVMHSAINYREKKDKTGIIKFGRWENGRLALAYTKVGEALPESSGYTVRKATEARLTIEEGKNIEINGTTGEILIGRSSDRTILTDSKYIESKIALIEGEPNALKKYALAKDLNFELEKAAIDNARAKEILRQAQQAAANTVQEKLSEIKALAEKRSLNTRETERSLRLIEEAEYWRNYGGNEGIAAAVEALSEKIKQEARKSNDEITEVDKLGLNDMSEYGAKNVGAGFSYNIADKVSKKVGVKIYAPKGKAVGKKSFEKYMEGTGIAELLQNLENAKKNNNKEEAAEIGKKIQKLIRETDNKKVKEEIKKALGLKSAIRYAARSSGIGEDGKENAFAGMGKSYLNLSADETAEYVLKVWESFFDEAGIAYMTENGLTVMPAVLVQEMVERVEKSGVILNGIIGSVYGLGEGIVSGRFTGDTAHVINGEISYVKAQGRSGKIVNDERGGTKEVALDKAERGVRVLSDEEVLLLNNIQVELEGEAGYPVDIEWAIDEDGKIHILQIRPVTDFIKDYSDTAAERETAAIGAEQVSADVNSVKFTSDVSPLSVIAERVSASATSSHHIADIETNEAVIDDLKQGKLVELSLKPNEGEDMSVHLIRIAGLMHTLTDKAADGLFAGRHDVDVEAFKRTLPYMLEHSLTYDNNYDFAQKLYIYIDSKTGAAKVVSHAESLNSKRGIESFPNVNVQFSGTVEELSDKQIVHIASFEPAGARLELNFTSKIADVLGLKGGGIFKQVLRGVVVGIIEFVPSAVLPPFIFVMMHYRNEYGVDLITSAGSQRYKESHAARTKGARVINYGTWAFILAGGLLASFAALPAVWAAVAAIIYNVFSHAAYNVLNSDAKLELGSYRQLSLFDSDDESSETPGSSEYEEESEPAIVYVEEGYRDSGGRPYYIATYSDDSINEVDEETYRAFWRGLLPASERELFDNTAVAAADAEYEAMDAEKERLKAAWEKAKKDVNALSYGIFSKKHGEVLLPNGNKIVAGKEFIDGKGLFISRLLSPSGRTIGRPVEILFYNPYDLKGHKITYTRKDSNGNEITESPTRRFGYETLRLMYADKNSSEFKLTLPLLAPLASALKFFGVKPETRETIIAVIELPLVTIASYSPAFNETFIKWHRSKTAQQVRSRERGMEFVRRSMNYAWKTAAQRATSSSPVIRSIQRITFGIAGMISANIKAHVRHNLNNSYAKLNLAESQSSGKFAVEKLDAYMASLDKDERNRVTRLVLSAAQNDDWHVQLAVSGLRVGDLSESELQRFENADPATIKFFAQKVEQYEPELMETADRLIDALWENNFQAPAGNRLFEELKGRIKNDVPTAITFVCSENQNRSAVPEIFFRQKLKNNNNKNIQVMSAGAFIDERGGVGNSSLNPEYARDLKNRYNVDEELITSFSKEQFAQKHARADYIIAADAKHKKWVLENYPELAGKVYLFSEIVPNVSSLESILNFTDVPGQPMVNERNILARVDRFSEYFFAGESSEIFAASDGNAKLELSSTKKIADRLKLKKGSWARAVFVARAEFEKSLLPGFVDMHYGEDGPAEEERNSDEYKTRIKGDKIIKAVTAVTRAICFGRITKFVKAANIITHIIYNLIVSTNSRLDTSLTNGRTPADYLGESREYKTLLDRKRNGTVAERQEFKDIFIKAGLLNENDFIDKPGIPLDAEISTSDGSKTFMLRDIIDILFNADRQIERKDNSRHRGFINVIYENQDEMKEGLLFVVGFLKNCFEKSLNIRDNGFINNETIDVAFIVDNKRIRELVRDRRENEAELQAILEYALHFISGDVEGVEDLRKFDTSKTTTAVGLDANDKIIKRKVIDVLKDVANGRSVDSLGGELTPHAVLYDAGEEVKGKRDYVLILGDVNGFYMPVKTTTQEGALRIATCVSPFANEQGHISGNNGKAIGKTVSEFCERMDGEIEDLKKSGNLTETTAKNINKKIFEFEANLDTLKIGFLKIPTAQGRVPIKNSFIRNINAIKDRLKTTETVIEKIVKDVKGKETSELEKKLAKLEQELKNAIGYESVNIAYYKFLLVSKHFEIENTVNKSLEAAMNNGEYDTLEKTAAAAISFFAANLISSDYMRAVEKYDSLIINGIVDRIKADQPNLSGETIDIAKLSDLLEKAISMQGKLMEAADKKIKEHFDMVAVAQRIDLEALIKDEKKIESLIDDILKESLYSDFEVYFMDMDAELERDTTKQMLYSALKVKIGMEALRKQVLTRKEMKIEISKLFGFDNTSLEARLMLNEARVTLTLPETQRELDERGYAGLKKYLYVGVVELGKLFLNSSKKFSLMHDNASVYQFKKRMQRATIIKALSIALPSAIILPAMIAGFTFAGLFFIPAVAAGGIFWHALSNYIEDKRIGESKVFNVYGENFLDERSVYYNSGLGAAEIKEATGNDIESIKANINQIRVLFETPEYYENGLILKYKTERFIEDILDGMMILEYSSVFEDDLFELIKNNLGEHTTSNFLQNYILTKINTYLKDSSRDTEQDNARLRGYALLLEHYIKLNGMVLSQKQDVNEEEFIYRVKNLNKTSRMIIHLYNALYGKDFLEKMNELFMKISITKESGVIAAQIFTNTYMSEFGYIPDELLAVYISEEKIREIQTYYMSSRNLKGFLKMTVPDELSSSLERTDSQLPLPLISLYIQMSASKDEVYEVIKDETLPLYYRLAAFKAIAEMPYILSDIKDLLQRMEKNSRMREAEELWKDVPYENLLTDAERSKLIEASGKLLDDIRTGKVDLTNEKNEYIKSLIVPIVLTASVLSEGKDTTDEDIISSLKALEFSLVNKSSIEVAFKDGESGKSKLFSVQADSKEKYATFFKTLAKELIKSASFMFLITVLAGVLSVNINASNGEGRSVFATEPTQTATQGFQQIESENFRKSVSGLVIDNETEKMLSEIAQNPPEGINWSFNASDHSLDIKMDGLSYEEVKAAFLVALDKCLDSNAYKKKIIMRDIIVTESEYGNVISFRSFVGYSLRSDRFTGMKIFPFLVNEDMSDHRINEKGSFNEYNAEKEIETKDAPITMFSSFFEKTKALFNGLFLIALTPLVGKRRKNEDKGNAVSLNYRFIRDQIALSDLERYGVQKRDGEISVPVYIIDMMPAGKEEFKFKNTGLKINGKSVWISSESNALVIFAEGATFAEIEEAVKNDNKRIGAEISKLVKKAAGIKIKTGLSLDWINVNTNAEKTSLNYDDNGNVRVNLSAEDSKYGTEVAKYMTGVREVRDADAAAAVQNIYYFLDDVKTAKDLGAVLSDFQKIGNGQIVLDYSVLKNNLSDEKIKEFFAAAHSNGIKIISDLRGQDISAGFGNYRNAGFDGVLYNASANVLSVYDFALASERKASVVEGYGDSQELVKKLQETNNIKILNSSEITAKLAGDSRSMIDKIQILKILKSSALLGALKKDRYTADFVRNAAYGFTSESLAAFDNVSTEELMRLLGSKDMDAVKKYLNLPDTHPVMIYLERNIQDNIENRSEILAVQTAFLEAVLEKVLVSKAAAGTIVNKDLEKALGKALRTQLQSGEKAQPPVSAEDFKESVRERTYAAAKGMSKKAADRMFSRNLQADLSEEIKSLTEDAFVKKDAVALAGIIELIPAIAEVRFNMSIDKDNVAQFDVRQVRSLLTAA